MTNRPFESLKELRRKVPSAPVEPETPKPKPAKLRPEASETDEEILARAMADVTPLSERERVARGASSSKTPRTKDEAAAVDAYLRDLVDGVVPFDIADTDEYIEGAVQGFDRRVLRRLRKGEFSLQGHVDLHGLNREEARAAVTRFIRKSHKKGHRCVLIVHGRGLNSKDQIPVLKEKLKAWLTRGAIGNLVLGFASARPYDGGTGAVYVLLRR